MLDLDRAGDPTLMLDQEDHGIALGGVVATPKHHVAVMGSWPGGRNTHPCTLGEERGYLLVRHLQHMRQSARPQRTVVGRQATVSQARDKLLTAALIIP